MCSSKRIFFFGKMLSQDRPWTKLLNIYWGNRIKYRIRSILAQQIGFQTTRRKSSLTFNNVMNLQQMGKLLRWDWQRWANPSPKSHLCFAIALK